MRIVDFLLNVLGWLQIVFTTTFTGFLAGFAIYYFQNSVGLIAAWILAIPGFIIGCILATRIWIKHGTINWLGSIKRVK